MVVDECYVCIVEMMVCICVVEQCVYVVGVNCCCYVVVFVVEIECVMCVDFVDQVY